MDQLRRNSATLVDQVRFSLSLSLPAVHRVCECCTLSVTLQAEMVSRELIRVAILWSEMWHEVRPPWFSF